MNFFKKIFEWFFDIMLVFVYWGILFIFIALPLGLIGALFYKLIGPTTEFGITLMSILALVTLWFVTTKTSIGRQYVGFVEKISQYFENFLRG